MNSGLECLRCGNCCPDDCESKRIEPNGLVTCLTHPSITGKRRNVLMCEISPIKLFVAGIACKAALTVFEEAGEPLNRETVKLENGQIILK